MFILEPVFHETIWGGCRLLKGAESNVQKVGHLYMVNGHKGMSNKIRNGSYSGKHLSDVFQLQKEDWNMMGFDEFPLTIALVDASQDLSIQVHPDDLTAGHLEQKRIGKTESWFFLEAPVCGWIYNGCNCDTKKQIQDAVIQGKMEEITKRLPVGINDYVYVEAGTLHALTAGSLVYEIEYGGDFTYRFYDYGRRDEKGNQRELHIDKAIETIKPENISKVRKNVNHKWITEESYEILRLTGLESYRNKSDELECISIICGYGTCDGCKVGGGTGIILFPGEELRDIQFEEIIIAKMRRK